VVVINLSGGHEMAPRPPTLGRAPAKPWRASTSRSSMRPRDAQAPCRVHHGVDDGVIPGAATDVAGELLTDLLAARVGQPAEEIVDREQEPRRAVAALKREVVAERGLDRMELA